MTENLKEVEKSTERETEVFEKKPQSATENTKHTLKTSQSQTPKLVSASHENSKKKFSKMQANNYFFKSNTRS